MMPVIRISERTLERLKASARPFEDRTPEDVVNRALDALDAGGSSTVKPAAVLRAPTTVRDQQKPGGVPKLPQKEFRVPLLELLNQMGGKASVREIRQQMEPRIADRLGPADYATVSSGDPRWWNAVCWERNDMIKAGLLRDDSERGTWELSQEGHAVAAEMSDRAEDGGDSDTWRDDLEAVLDEIDEGEGAPLDLVYDCAATRRAAAGRTLTANFKATIRRTLEDNSSDSDNFRGADIFYMPRGKGAGIWGLRRKRKP